MENSLPTLVQITMEVSDEQTPDKSYTVVRSIPISVPRALEPPVEDGA